MKYVVRLVSAVVASVAVVLAAHSVSGPAEAVFASAGYSKSGPVNSDNAIVLDQDSETIRVHARVNGKYLYLPTRHGMNYRAGRIGDKALFRAWANPVDFDKALLELGAEPGQNLDGSTGGEVIQGDDLTIRVDWEGAAHSYALDELVADSNGKGVAYRFGGNLDLAKQAMTGCLMCFDSCSVGVSSNALYPQGSFHKQGLGFRGRADRLPPDGTPVTVIFGIAES